MKEKALAWGLVLVLACDEMPAISSELSRTIRYLVAHFVGSDLHGGKLACTTSFHFLSMGIFYFILK